MSRSYIGGQFFHRSPWLWYFKLFFDKRFENSNDRQSLFKMRRVLRVFSGVILLD